jgi:hypothetical protein
MTLVPFHVIAGAIAIGSGFVALMTRDHGVLAVALRRKRIARGVVGACLAVAHGERERRVVSMLEAI